jgi:hypothetical protein
MGEDQYVSSSTGSEQHSRDEGWGVLMQEAVGEAGAGDLVMTVMMNGGPVVSPNWLVQHSNDER